MIRLPNGYDYRLADTSLEQPHESVDITQAMHDQDTVARVLGVEGYAWMATVATPLNGDHPVGKFFLRTPVSEQQPTTVHVFRNELVHYGPDLTMASMSRQGDYRTDRADYGPGDLAVVDDNTLTKLQSLGRMGSKGYREATRDPESPYYNLRSTKIAARSGSIMLGRAHEDTDEMLAHIPGNDSHLHMPEQRARIATAENGTITVTSLSRSGAKVTYRPVD